MSEQDQSQTDDIIIPADDADQNDDHAEQHDDAGTEPQDGEGQADDDAVVVTIGDEQPPEEEQHAQAPAWVKELRKSQRELQRENRELKARLQQGAAQAAARIESQEEIADNRNAVNMTRINVQQQLARERNNAPQRR